MQAFLDFVDKWAHYTAVVLAVVWFASLVFVMRNAQVQEFVVAYGFQTSTTFLALSIAAHWLAKWHRDLSLADVEKRHAITACFVGSAILIWCGFTVSVLPTRWVSALSLVFLTLAIFGLLLFLDAFCDWRKGTKRSTL